MDIEHLISGLDVRRVDHAGQSVRVCDITEDSRTILPGSLFIARRGGTHDGRSFIKDALQAGASAILTNDADLRLPSPTDAALVFTEDLATTTAQIAERFYGDPSQQLKLIGVTGTNGKTTIAFLIRRILNAAGLKCGMIGTILVDDGCEVGPASLTTPPATELSRTLGVMVESGCKAAVVEVSSHALDQGRAAALSFDVGVFTNLTGDHLDYHETPERYAAAKAKLFGRLEGDGRAIVNAEDPVSRRMVRDCAAPSVSCGLDEGVSNSAFDEECRAEILSMSINGARARYTGPWGTIEVSTRITGRHNVMNALQAIAAAHALGLDAKQLASGLADAPPPPGRLEPVTIAGDPFAILVDYAHTDDALDKALTAVRPLVPAGSRLWVVFGCGGDRDRTKRPRMGRVAAALADQIVVTSDNPRTEQANTIIDDILEGIELEARPRTTVQADRAQAIEHAVDHAGKGDVIVIAGKGHEDYQILPDARGGTYTRHFDDRETAREALRAFSFRIKASVEA